MPTRRSGTKILIAIMSLLVSLQFSATHAQKNTVSKPSVRSVTKEDSLQYAMGIYVGKWIRENGFTQVDAAQFMAGIDDILKQKPARFNDSTVTAVLNTQKRKLELARARQLEARMFASIVDTPGVQTLSNGIKYIVRREGKGIKPTDKDSVVISFKGVLADGSVWENTYEKNIGVYTTPSILFPGLRLALLSMPAGSLWQIYIPSAMAYGDIGNGIVPAGSAIAMLVSLVQVKKNP